VFYTLKWLLLPTRLLLLLKTWDILGFGSSQQARSFTQRNRTEVVSFTRMHFLTTPPRFKSDSTRALGVPTRPQLPTRDNALGSARSSTFPPRLPTVTSSSAVHSQLKGCTLKKLQLKSQIIKAAAVLLHWIHWCGYSLTTWALTGRSTFPCRHNALQPLDN